MGSGYRGGASLLALIASVPFPGLGFLMAGRPRLAIAAFVGIVVTICAFGWSRVVLLPAGYWACLVTVFLFLIGAAAYSAWITWAEYEKRAIAGRWKGILVFMVAVVVLSNVLATHRDQIFGFETFRVPSGSMANTLSAGDYILVDTWAYREAGPEFGELVVFAVPETELFHVKRVVGLPGEHFETREGAAVRDGDEMDEPYATFLFPDRTMPISPYAEIEIPAGHYYMLGDNRQNSMDSRMYGPVSGDDIHGRVVHRWLSSESEFPTRF